MTLTHAHPRFTRSACGALTALSLAACGGGGGDSHDTGSATYRFGTDTQLVLDVQAKGLAVERVTTVMQGRGSSPAEAGYVAGLERTLRQDIATWQQALPADALGLIPQRLPPVSWREGRAPEPGYAMVDIDPLTATARYPQLRYNDNFTPYNADATDPQQRLMVTDRLIDSARRRGALAAQWEVRTARMQQDAGIANAGLGEEERAARSGLAAARDAVTGAALPGQFKPLALDLNGDGALSTVTLAQNVRAYNWDGSGFFKRVGWVGAADGLLFLRRDPRVTVDAGRDVFSNSSVADAAKGPAALASVDANGDGRIDGTDPVFPFLRVWRDANGDAIPDAAELQTLAQIGITELDYRNRRFMRSGVWAVMDGVTLEASATGVRIRVTAATTQP